MSLVQPESGHDQAAAHFGADGPQGAADPMAHAMFGPQEPPSADHLFADAQMMDQGGMHTAGTDAHAATSFHADVPAAPPPEPPPVEQHDGGGHV
jgi:hypothetical protein